MQDRMHLLRDGHFDVHLFGKADSSVSGQYAFGDHAVHAGNDVVELPSFAEFDADGAVARKASGAGENEVAHAGQSGERFLASAASDGETGDFG